MFDISRPIESLKTSRKMFHSEADFQFALAWEIQRFFPEAKIRLEYCPTALPNMHIDILVELDNYLYPIELKYKTLEIFMQIDCESFNLKSHGAQDIGKYDCLFDIQRIELFQGKLPRFHQGFAVWLTNDPAYWSKPKRSNTIAEDFRLYDGTMKSGELAWASHAGAGTTRNRTDSIKLVGSYTIEWKEYSKISNERNGSFRYAINRVGSD